MLLRLCPAQALIGLSTPQGTMGPLTWWGRYYVAATLGLQWCLPVPTMFLPCHGITINSSVASHSTMAPMDIKGRLCCGP